jgi:hypothetical protein
MMRTMATALALACVLAPLPARAGDRDDVVKVVTDAYLNGVHVRPDAGAMRKGFHPDFRMLVLTDGKMSAVTLEEWAARIEKAAASPAAPNPAIRYEIPQVEVTGTAATVKIELWRNEVHTFTDYLSLYKFADGWKIVGKTFHRHPAPGTR